VVLDCWLSWFGPPAWKVVVTWPWLLLSWIRA
jgi:hypothetical protein